MFRVFEETQMTPLKSMSSVIVNGVTIGGFQCTNSTDRFSHSSNVGSSTLVTAKEWNRHICFRPRRILVVVDFSEASEDARRFASAIAIASDAVIDFVHVFDAFTEVFVRKNVYGLDEVEKMMAAIERALSRRAGLARSVGVRATHTRLVGAPGLELPTHATSTGADLIVLGDGENEPGCYGWTSGRQVARQIINSTRWKGFLILQT
jgi:nucleotide-binding universal stress UspA family protein